MSGRIVYGEDSEEEETDEESSSEEEQHEQTPDHQVALPLEESQSPSPSSPQTQGQEEPPVAAQDQHIKESSLLSSTSSVSPSSLDQQGHHPQQQTRDDTAAKKGSTSGTQTGSPIITEGVERQSVTSIHGSTPVSLSSSSSSSSSVSSPAVPSSSSASPPPETPVMRNLRIKMNRLDRCIRKSVYDHVSCALLNVYAYTKSERDRRDEGWQGQYTHECEATLYIYIFVDGYYT